ncbi:MAG: hypothetical protein FWF12_03955 [Betaproteobacteria bacterium]|nr:hypothetical protein [Betaproteobacteria bacterium]
MSKGVLMLDFEFNPSRISRTRTVSVKTAGLAGTRGGYDFATPMDALRAAQGVFAEPESFDISIMLDATDRMEAGDPIASAMGIQPEIDVIRSMLEPKSMQPDGARMLTSLGKGNERSFPQYQALSVLIFKWGLVHMLPVFMTRAQIETQEFLPTLMPYRAEVSLSLQIIESRNPFYIAENVRQTLSAATNIMHNTTATFPFGM